MHRSLILDFLSKKRDQLNNFKFSHLSICMFGRLNHNDLSRLFLKSDEVIVYQVKEPRIYEKTYSLNNIEKTILDMVFFSKTKIYLRKEDFHEKMLDPYYLKDIREQNFVSMCLFPILKDEEVVGAMLFYFNDDAYEFSCSQNELEKVFCRLQDCFSLEIEREIDDAILKHENYQKIIFLKDYSKCFLDNRIKQKLRLNDNLINMNQNLSINKKINGEIRKNGYHQVEKERMNIYYRSINNINNSEDLLKLSLTEINNFRVDDFTIVVVENVDLDDLILGMCQDKKIQKYSINDHSWCYKIEGLWKEEFVRSVKELVKNEYFIVINSKQISSKMDLEPLIKYIIEHKPTEYDYQAYCKYRNNLSQMAQYTDFDVVETGQAKYFVNSLNQVEYGILPNIFQSKIETITEQSCFVKNINKLIESIKKNQSSNFIIPLIPEILDSKKFFFDINQIRQFDCNVKVLITYPKYESLESNRITTLEKNIAKMKEKGIYVIMDSSIYFNFQLLHLLEISDAVYLKKEEYQSLIKYPGGINSAIFQYMITNYKELVIDFNINETDEKYHHALFNYRKDKL